MVKEFLNLLKPFSMEEVEQMALDNYLLSEGYYFKLSKDGILSEPKYFEKNTRGDDWFLKRDFYSQVINQKELDGYHRLRTNNYLSLGFKTKTKIIDESYFFSIIKPKIIEFEEFCNSLQMQLPDYDIDEVDKYINLLSQAFKESISRVNSCLGEEDTTTKEVLIKIFIDEDIIKYRNTSSKYLAANIFSDKNAHTKVTDNGIIVGGSTFNFNNNPNKKYNSPLKTNYDVPFLISLEDAMRIHYFSTVLIGLNEQRKEKKQEKYLYFSYNESFKGLTGKNINGFKISCRKGKQGIDILDFSYILQENEIDNFHIRNILNEQYINEYTIVDALNKNILGFSLNIYDDEYTPSDDKNVDSFLYTHRNNLLSWLKKEDTYNKFITPLLRLVVHKIQLEESEIKRKNILNTYLNVLERDTITMDISQLIAKLNEKSKDTFELESDEEYLFSIGQLAKYLTTLSQSKDKDYNMVYGILNSKTHIVLKNNLTRLMQKYSHNVSYKNKKYTNLCAAIFSYTPTNETIDLTTLLCGIHAQNIIYIKENKEDE